MGLLRLNLVLICNELNNNARRMVKIGSSGAAEPKPICSGEFKVQCVNNLRNAIGKMYVARNGQLLNNDVYSKRKRPKASRSAFEIWWYGINDKRLKTPEFSLCRMFYHAIGWIIARNRRKIDWSAFVLSHHWCLILIIHVYFSWKVFRR